MNYFQILTLAVLVVAHFNLSKSHTQNIISENEDDLKCLEGSDLDNPPECPTQEGELPVYFPHPDDCSQFYQCSNGRAYCHKCGRGTLWDQENLVCNHPHLVSCPITVDPIDWVCPEDYTGLIGHPFKCKLFYLCTPDRRPAQFECPGNLCFNPDFEGTESDVKTQNENTLKPIGKVVSHANVNRRNFENTVDYIEKGSKANVVGFNGPCVFVTNHIDI